MPGKHLTGAAGSCPTPRRLPAPRRRRSPTGSQSWFRCGSAGAPRDHMGTAKALPLRCFCRTHVDAGTQRGHPTTSGKAPSPRQVTFHDRRPWTASWWWRAAATTFPGPRSAPRAHPLPAPDPHEGDHSSVTTPTISTTTTRRGHQQRKHQHSSTAPTKTDEAAPAEEHHHQHLRDEEHHQQGRGAQQTNKKPNLITLVALKCTPATDVAVSDLPARPCPSNYPCDHNLSNLPCLLFRTAGQGPSTSGLLLLGLLLQSPCQTHTRPTDR